MKKGFFVGLVMVMLLGFAVNVYAADIVFKDLNIKAAALSQAVYNNVNLINQNEIDESEAILFTSLDLSYKNISNSNDFNDDILYFTGLTQLNVSNNQLTTLDISHNTALTNLDVSSNQLTALDVSHNAALTQLSAYNNSSLTSLDVSYNTALTSLNVDDCNLSTLNLSSNAALQNLSVANNPLISLDVSNNPALTGLFISGCGLSTLNLSNNTNLAYLNADNNNLTALNISNNTALGGLSVSHNQLTTLDVSHNTALINLDVSYNRLTALNVLNNTNLQHLDVTDNDLTVLNVSTNTALLTLDVNDNDLTTLDVTYNTNLFRLDVSGNKMSSPTDVTGRHNGLGSGFIFGTQQGGGGGFVAVTGITITNATTGVVGTPITLTGIVEPTDAANNSLATNKTIVWSLATPPATTGAKGAYVSNGQAGATGSAGWVGVIATVRNGLAPGRDYVEPTFWIYFSAVPHQLKITADTGGSITQGKDGQYTVGTQIPITAVADAGYTFYRWTTSNGGAFTDANAATSRFEMPNNDVIITAHFTRGGGGGQPGNAVYGDLNNDGRINNADLILMQRYFSVPGITINTANADVNGDGRVNNADQILFLRYFAIPGVRLGP